MNFFPELFYNLIPGTLFLFLMNFSTNGDVIRFIKSLLPGMYSGLLNNEQVFGFLLLTISLLTGFVLDEIENILRKSGILHEFSDDESYKKLFIKNKKVFKYANELFYNEGLLVKYAEPPSVENTRQLLHLMNNYLVAENKAKNIYYYKDKHTFWSNILWGSLVIAVFHFIGVCVYALNGEFLEKQLLIAILSISIAMFTYPISKRFINYYHDTTLKTFVTLYVLKKKNTTLAGAGLQPGP